MLKKRLIAIVARMTRGVMLEELEKDHQTRNKISTEKLTAKNKTETETSTESDPEDVKRKKELMKSKINKITKIQQRYKTEDEQESEEEMQLRKYKEKKKKSVPDTWSRAVYRGITAGNVAELLYLIALGIP